MAIRNAVGLLGGSGELDEESFWYSVKRRLLGPPMVNEQLRHQRLSKPLALGVLSPDGISSSAYGTEEILIALLPLMLAIGAGGLAVSHRQDGSESLFGPRAAWRYRSFGLGRR